MKCLSRCLSPVACSGFGYCRERNFDGTPMTEEKVKRLRKEEELATETELAWDIIRPYNHD